MPTCKKVGVTRRDSRVALRTLTIATATALLLCATSVQAAVVNLVVDPSLSSLTIGGDISNAFLGVIPIEPQTAGAVNGNIASYSGNISIDVGAGTIQLLPGSSIVAAITGNWAPEDLGDGNDPVGGTGPANYGLVVGDPINALIAYNGLEMDFGAVGFPSTAMPLSGSDFNLTGQAMAFTSGRQVLISDLAPAEGSAIGFPTIFGTGGVEDIGTWDGTTLTIPVHSEYTYLIGTVPIVGDVYGTITFTGELVARVPEPSSLILAGFGLIGMVGVGYRARKRRA